MIVLTSEEVVTAPALESAEVIPVLVRRGENERFTGALVLNAHDCGNDVGFGVDPVRGEAPDSLEQEFLIRSLFDELAVAGSDELDLIGGGCHACILLRKGQSVKRRTYKDRDFPCPNLPMSWGMRGCRVLPLACG